MDPSITAILAVGAFLLSSVATVINIVKARRENALHTVEEAAERVRADSEAQLGSVEAAERLIALYGRTVADLRDQAASLRERVSHLETIVGTQMKRISELEQENNRLRGAQQ